MFRVLISALVIFLVFISNAKTQSSDSPLEINDRIVGGSAVKVRYRNFQVALIVGPYVCGGSLLSMQWILSAAHCVYGESVSSTYARAGSNNWDYGGVVKWAKTLIPHSNYDPETYDFDISLILLKSPFTRNEFVDSIPRASNLPADGKLLEVSGYGTTSSGGNFAPYLLNVFVNMISFEKCNQLYDGELTERMFCAGVPEGGKDSCQGDSGGPITYNGYLIGVVSWGYGCAAKEYPGVYTRVPYFDTWIENTMRNNN
ncbi:trypsin-like [Condylostylus longicornis]|uniref:trypsin-like n=1 Tax=Condylostylus longicornis TaxID=2530218 RepID=UPI00244E23DD|nr:trypsin-like [Condylostylus longicornis]